MNPDHQIERTYIVKIDGDLTPDEVAILRKGIQENGELLQPKEVRVLKESQKESTLEITLAEGKNREIRRMIQFFRRDVTRLKRIRFGALELGSLQPSEWREVIASELSFIQIKNLE